MREKENGCPVQKRYVVRVGKASIVGRGRAGGANQDSVCALSHSAGLIENAGIEAVLAVADGMGGGYAGEKASKKAVEMLIALFWQGDYRTWAKENGLNPEEFLHILKERVREIHESIMSMGRSIGKVMGTTLSSLIVKDGRYYIVHCGDSRVYLVRSGEVKQLTRDHSVVQELVDSNIPLERARAMAGDNLVTNILGATPGVEINVSSGPVYEDDWFVVSSDGFHGSIGRNIISKGDILWAIRKLREAQAICDTLVEKANRRDGSDNISVAIAHVATPSCVEVPDRTFSPGAPVKRKIDTRRVWLFLLMLFFLGVVVWFLVVCFGSYAVPEGTGVKKKQGVVPSRESRGERQPGTKGTSNR